jgi:hypothetical protein
MADLVDGKVYFPGLVYPSRVEAGALGLPEGATTEATDATIRDFCLMTTGQPDCEWTSVLELPVGAPGQRGILHGTGAPHHPDDYPH